MTTIQDRIIKDFRELRTTSYEDPLIISDEEAELVEEFLIDSIKKIEEETRKETKQEIAELKIKVRDLTNHCKNL